MENWARNLALHITQPGTYSLTGQWHGQIRIDLGDEGEVYAAPDQTVTLILNGVEVSCTVAAISLAILLLAKKKPTRED